MIARQPHRTKVDIKWKVKNKPYGGKRQALTQDELDRLFAALKITAMAIGTIWSHW